MRERVQSYYFETFNQLGLPVFGVNTFVLIIFHGYFPLSFHSDCFVQKRENVGQWILFNISPQLFYSYTELASDLDSVGKGSSDVTFLLNYSTFFSVSSNSSVIW